MVQKPPLPPAPEHPFQLTSMGGAGTSAIRRSLIQQGVDLARSPEFPDGGPYKHQPKPFAGDVPVGFRVLVLIGDPRLTTMSVLRRRRDTPPIEPFSIAHYNRMNGFSGFADVPARLSEPLRTLDGILNLPEDPFHYAQFVNAWTQTEGLPYDVCVAKSPEIWGHWAEIREFLRLDDVQLPEFLPRNSALGRLDDYQRDRMDRLFGEAMLAIDALDDVTFRPSIEVNLAREFGESLQKESPGLG